MNIYSTMYHPKKPEGIEKRKAYIVGGGLAGLAAAAFLVDDAGGNLFDQWFGFSVPKQACLHVRVLACALGAPDGLGHGVYSVVNAG